MENTSKKYDADVVIFRMAMDDGISIIPPMNHTTTFEEDYVGISFAVKTSFYKNNGLYFIPSDKEDFYFLDRARTMGAKIVIADEIAYFVKDHTLEIDGVKQLVRMWGMLSVLIVLVGIYNSWRTYQRHKKDLRWTL